MMTAKTRPIVTGNTVNIIFLEAQKMRTFKFNEEILRQISWIASAYSIYYVVGFIAGGFIGFLRLKREKES